MSVDDFIQLEILAQFSISCFVFRDQEDQNLHGVQDRNFLVIIAKILPNAAHSPVAKEGSR